MDTLLALAVAFSETWALYGLLAVAFSLGVRVGGFFDLSVGVEFLVGGYGTLVLCRVVPLWLAVPGGALLAGLASAMIGWLVILPLVRRASPTAMFVATLAVMYVAQASCGIIFGESAVVARAGPSHAFDVGPVRLTYFQVALGAAAVALLAGVSAWLRLSKWGRFSRAVADDRDNARLLGIPVDGVILRSYGIIGVLAGVTGSFFVTGRTIEPGQAFSSLLSAMVAALMAGESVAMAVLGAAVLAALDTAFGFIATGNWKATIAFALLLAVMIGRRGALFHVARRSI